MFSLFHSSEIYALGQQGHRTNDILTQFYTIINKEMMEKMGEKRWIG